MVRRDTANKVPHKRAWPMASNVMLPAALQTGHKVCTSAIEDSCSKSGEWLPSELSERSNSSYPAHAQRPQVRQLCPKNRAMRHTHGHVQALGDLSSGSKTKNNVVVQQMPAPLCPWPLAPRARVAGNTSSAATEHKAPVPPQVPGTCVYTLSDRAPEQR